MSEVEQVDLLIEGCGGVGKSSLTLRFISGTFVSDYDPTIEDTYTKQIEIDSKPYILKILDTAGQDEFSTMNENWWYRQSYKCDLYVYDITNVKTFNQIRQIRQKRLKKATETDSEQLVGVLCGNKCDLEANRQVKVSEGEDLRKELNLFGFFEVSAKDNINVNKAFIKCCAEYLRIKHTPYPDSKPTKKPNNSCCQIL